MIEQRIDRGLKQNESMDTLSKNVQRSELIGQAVSTCTRCLGHGLTSRGNVCPCVERACFRDCLERFRECAAGARFCAPVFMERMAGRRGRFGYGRKNEEYMADFCLVSKRALDAFEYQVFKFHYLLGADWKLCCRRLGIDRGRFYHAAYRVEAKLGHTFRTLSPYPLWPLADYFAGTVHQAAAAGDMSAGKADSQAA